MSTPTLSLQLPRPHIAQRTVLREARRFNVAALGRRTGKTTLGINLEVEAALPGYPVAWFSPTYKMLADVWRDTRRLLAPVLTGVNVQDHRFQLLGGGVIEFWSLEQPDAARGRKYRRIVIDEAAMVRDLEDAWQAVIRPTLTDYEGDAWFFSTPKGRNFFWQLWTRGPDAGYADWASWQMPTTANPFINPAEVEAARLELPERTYAQEYLAAFLEDGGGVFRRVLESSTATAQERATDRHQYVMGVDWGRLEDFTVLNIIDVTTREQVVVDRFNTIEYQTQLGRLRALYDRFKPSTIIAEQNSIGIPLIEQMQRDNLPVQPFLTTNATKAAAIDALSLAFERGDLQILPDPVQTAELQAYEAERLPSGLMRYGAPSGQHDDCVMSLAMAYQGCLNSGPLLLWGADEYDDD